MPNLKKHIHFLKLFKIKFTIDYGYKVDNISLKEIQDVYEPNGFKYFKLEGRTAHPLDWIEIILYYLIKEEYKEEVRAKLQQAIW